MSSTNLNSRSKLKFVAVHLGVSDSKNNNLKLDEFARVICDRVMMQANQNKFNSTEHCVCLKGNVNSYIQTKAEEAVIELVRLMEDNPSLNCGLGSNLNMDGQVECDASLMRNRNITFAGVGGIMGCKNPIKLAESLVRHQACPRPLGLMQPNLLFGSSGGKKWMRDHCPKLLIHDSELIAKNSLKQYQSNKSRYDKSMKCPSLEEPHSSCAHDDFRFDTVGAIAVDEDNNIACATSSGGIALKHKGRIGQAALPGAGCWTQTSIAVTTSGVGELLTLNLFARKVHDKLHHALDDLDSDTYLPQIKSSLSQCFTELVETPTSTKHETIQNSAGTLSVIVCGQELFLAVGHNTKSMNVAYRSNYPNEVASSLKCSDDVCLQEPQLKLNIHVIKINTNSL